LVCNEIFAQDHALYTSMLDSVQLYLRARTRTLYYHGTQAEAI